MPDTAIPVMPSTELLTVLTHALNPATVSPALCAVDLARLALIVCEASTALTRADIPTSAADTAMTAAEDAAALATLLKNLSEALVADE